MQAPLDYSAVIAKSSVALKPLVRSAAPALCLTLTSRAPLLGPAGRAQQCTRMYDFCLTFPYAALLALGGVAGFAAKGSVPSLLGGLGSAVSGSGETFDCGPWCLEGVGRVGAEVAWDSADVLEHCSGHCFVLFVTCTTSFSASPIYPTALIRCCSRSAAGPAWRGTARARCTLAKGARPP